MHTENTQTIPTRMRVLRWAGPIFGLLWLWPLIVAFAVNDPSTGEIVLVGAGFAAFAPLFMLTAMTERPVLPPVLGMLAISVALTLAVDDAFAWMFAWAASAAAVRLDGLVSAKAVTAITALAAATLALTDPEGALFWGVTAAVAAMGTLWLLVGGLMRTNAALRDARAELAELAVAEERLRFSRDLHDLLGHDLSLIALKAELAGRLLPARADQAATEVEDIRELTRNALQQVREAVGGYRQPSLPSELAGAKVALEAAGIEVSVEGPDEPVDPDVEAVLAWAVREGATNAIRHSGARHAEIKLRPGPDTTELEFSDDGRGAPIVNGGGHGLTGLRERAQSVGGTVEAGAGPGGGFRVTVRVPARRSETPA
jgi:two-component system, NarL family, sensor histidine kinase DesK